MSKEKNNKGGKDLKIVIIILLVILIIGGGVFAGYFFYLNKNGNGAKAQAVPQGQQVNYNQSNVNGQNNAPINVVSAKTYCLDEFLVNLADEDGKRYIKVKIYIGYESKKMDKEVEAKKPIMRDAVNSVLRSKKVKDFTPKGVEDIKMEILNRVNPVFTTGRADNVYFYDIVVQ